MGYAAFEWLALVPGLLAAMVGIGLAIAWRERSPTASALLVAGLALCAAAPLLGATVHAFWNMLSPTAMGAAHFVLRLVGVGGAVLCVAAAAVGRPAREREDE